MRRLLWIVQALPDKPTADQLADKMLNEAIEAKYPQIVEAEKALETAEKQFAATFQE